MQTESECGDGRNTWEHMEYIFYQMWFYFWHGAERYTYWNMALKEGGISTWGWTQNSLCTVNPDGSIVLVVGNNMNRDREFSFVHDEKSFSAEIKAHSVHTFVID